MAESLMDLTKTKKIGTPASESEESSLAQQVLGKFIYLSKGLSQATQRDSSPRAQSWGRRHPACNERVSANKSRARRSLQFLNDFRYGIAAIINTLAACHSLNSLALQPAYLACNSASPITLSRLCRLNQSGEACHTSGQPFLCGRAALALSTSATGVLKWFPV
jgi:hypothetical protein